MEKLEVMIELAKARLEGRPIDPETMPSRHQEERQKAFETLIRDKLEHAVWVNLFIMKNDLWINNGPAIRSEVLTHEKRVSFTLRPVEGGFEFDGACGVVLLPDDDKFNDRLLVAVGEALDASPRKC